MILPLTQMASSIALGLLVGSWLTEAMVLVPFWRKMEPQNFLDHYAVLGPRIYTYFAPLTAIAILFPLIAALSPFLQGSTPGVYLLIPVVMTFTTLAMFIVYFKKSIADFKDGIVSDAGLAEDLRKWARWHSARLVLGMVAFVSSLLALSSGV